MLGLLLGVLVLAPLSLAEVISFENALVKQPEYLTIPKYAPGEVPHWSPGRGRSYIDLSRVKISQDCNRGRGQCSPVSVLDILLFEDQDSVSSWMNHWPGKNFCCTSDMVSSGDCNPSEIGSLHVPYTLPGTYKIRANVSSDQPVDLGMQVRSAHGILLTSTDTHCLAARDQGDGSVRDGACGMSDRLESHSSQRSHREPRSM